MEDEPPPKDVSEDSVGHSIDYEVEVPACFSSCDHN